MDALEMIGTMLKEQGVTLEELVEAGRAARGSISAREYGLRTDQ